MLNIKYDIVGSFLRPGKIKKARQKYADGNLSLEELRKIEDEAIRELVSTEVSHGLEFVTDGEFRRRWWHLDWLKEFDGFTTKHLDKERNGVVNHIVRNVCIRRLRRLIFFSARLKNIRV